MRQLAIFALLAVFAPWASAQRGASGFSHLSHFSPTGNGITSRSHFASYHRGYPGVPYGDALYPFGIFSDFYSGDSANFAYTGSVYPGAAPNFWVLPSARGEADQGQTPPESLMIELQGDRYVRVNNSDENVDNTPVSMNPAPALAANSVRAHSSRKTEPGTSELTASANPAKPVVTAELLPTVLIFRDGHSENVRDYAIADGVIYARGNYYTDGYWNKKIDVAALDVSQTVQANQARGVNFQLPSAPNEVITRP